MIRVGECTALALLEAVRGVFILHNQSWLAAIATLLQSVGQDRHSHFHFGCQCRSHLQEAYDQPFVTLTVRGRWSRLYIGHAFLSGTVGLSIKGEGTLSFETVHSSQPLCLRCAQIYGFQLRPPSQLCQRADETSRTRRSSPAYSKTPS